MFDDTRMDLPCPHCGKKTAKTVRWLKSHSQMTCPACGEGFRLDTSEFKRGLAAAEKKVADLRRQLSRLGKR